jgi:hypothetical protein
MPAGKNHSIMHTPGDVASYCDAINTSCDPLETAHKKWVKEQGVCTNQGDQLQLSIIIHSLHKEASSLLCEAVQGTLLHACLLFTLVILMQHMQNMIFCICCILSILYI